MSTLNRKIREILFGCRTFSICRPLIDPSYYKGRFIFVAKSYVTHFCLVGARSGAAPNAFFNPTWYMTTYPDVPRDALAALVHYATYGWKEGRNPSAAFSVNAYNSEHPDVGLRQVDPLIHFLHYGRAEGRKPIHVDRWSTILASSDPTSNAHGARALKEAEMLGVRRRKQAIAHRILASLEGEIGLDVHSKGREPELGLGSLG